VEAATTGAFHCTPAERSSTYCLFAPSVPVTGLLIPDSTHVPELVPSKVKVSAEAVTFACVLPDERKFREVVFKTDVDMFNVLCVYPNTSLKQKIISENIV